MRELSAYEAAQRAASKHIRHGIYSGKLAPYIASVHLPQEARALGAHVSAEIQQLNQNLSLNELYKICADKRHQKKTEERDALLRKLKRSVEPTPGTTLKDLLKEISALQEEAVRAEKVAERLALFAQLGRPASPPPADLKALVHEVAALKKDVKYAEKAAEFVALQGDLGMCVEPLSERIKRH